MSWKSNFEAKHFQKIDISWDHFDGKSVTNLFYKDFNSNLNTLIVKVTEMHTLIIKNLENSNVKSRARHNFDLLL